MTVTNLLSGAERLQSALGEASSSFSAWNNAQVFALQDAARAYVELQIALAFARAVDSAPDTVRLICLALSLCVSVCVLYM